MRGLAGGGQAGAVAGGCCGAAASDTAIAPASAIRIVGTNAWDLQHQQAVIEQSGIGISDWRRHILICNPQRRFAVRNPQRIIVRWRRSSRARRCASGHAMTLYSWGNPRYFPRLPAATRRYFDVAANTRVVADCHWHAAAGSRPTLLALHGLNGSSDAHYMRGLAAKAFARGMNVVRLNQRNCGDTEHLSEGLFHSGLTADAAHVIDELTRVDGLRGDRASPAIRSAATSR